MRGVQLTETVRPVRAPMDLDVGRLNPREAVQLVSLTVGALFVASLGALLAWSAWPEFGSWGPARLVFVTFGGLVALVGLGFGGLVAWLTVGDWTQYRRRLDEWHAVALASFEDNGGREVEQTMTAWDLTPAMPLHILGAALSVHRQVGQGTATPWSVRQLEGPCFLAGVRLGDVAPSSAEQIAKAFGQLGLVKGRGPRQAGEWAPQSEAEVVELVVSNWSKVK